MLFRSDAQRLTNELLKLVDERAVTKYHCTDPTSKAAFVAGYMNSVLARIAAQSPASLKELESSVNWLANN